jgi:hypothetical protein
MCAEVAQQCRPDAVHAQLRRLALVERVEQLGRVEVDDRRPVRPGDTAVDVREDGAPLALERQGHAHALLR